MDQDGIFIGESPPEEEDGLENSEDDVELDDEDDEDDDED